MGEGPKGVYVGKGDLYDRIETRGRKRKIVRERGDD